MLTVQYFVSHFKKNLVYKKKHLFICYLNQNMVTADTELSLCHNGSHEVLFVTLQYIQTPFCSVL